MMRCGKSKAPHTTDRRAAGVSRLVKWPDRSLTVVARYRIPFFNGLQRRLPAAENDTFHTDPKRQRGNGLSPSVTLRVSVIGNRRSGDMAVAMPDWSVSA